MTSRRILAREQAKLTLRRALLRADLGIGPDPFPRRVARTLSGRGIDTVLDIGANLGQYAALLRAAGFTGRIVSLEPLPDGYTTLTRRFRSDRDWTGVNAAAGAAPGRATLHVAANGYSSSLLRAARTQLETDASARAVADVDVEVTTVAAVCERHGIDPARTLLKVDTQGFEGAVLDGAGALLDDIAAVQLELSHAPMYDDQADADELTARLGGHGLTRWTFEPGVSGADGRLLQSDVLFVRA